MLLFFIGITIGIMYTIIAHKREVDKLNELLKQTQKLVEDLHEEEVELLELNVNTYSLSRTPDIAEVIMSPNHFNYAAYYWLTIQQKKNSLQEAVSVVTNLQSEAENDFLL